MAIFAIINAVLLKSLPVRDPQGLVVRGGATASGNGSGFPAGGSFSLYSYDLYKHLQGTNVFAGLRAVQSKLQTEVSSRSPVWKQAELGQPRLISGNYFEVVEVNIARGSTVAPEYDSASASLCRDSACHEPTL